MPVISIRWATVIFALLSVAACSRGPDAGRVESDLQAQLNEQFGRPVLLVKSLKRQGSSPLRAAEDGAKRALVYYNTVLQFAEPYDAADWDRLSPAVLAQSLGATEDGVAGFRSGGNGAGSELRAYGSAAYRKSANGWTLESPLLSEAQSARDTERQAAQEGRVAPSRADELVNRLAGLVDTSPGLRSADDEIIEEELDRAYRNITMRLERNRQRLVLAVGPEGGEYWRLVQSFSRTWDPTASPVVVATEGSVENALLVEAGDAQLALMQSDVAAAAVAGLGPFASTGPLRRLRALASIGPEPLHVVVRADSGIQGVNDLRGRRVGIGNAESGARFTARIVLAAHGLELTDLGKVFSGTPVLGLERLVAGDLDAVIMAVAVPWRQLSVAAGQTPLKLLALDESVIDHIYEQSQGLVPMTLAARSYQGQQEPVRTIAATALIVGDADLADVSVEAILGALFDPGRIDSARTARISRERALVGVTVPLHDGAGRFFSGTLDTLWSPTPPPATIDP
jgi:TRAP transporter TAXI family solute receptor